jgi:RNA polymerase sigma-70 factor, ECF subfamily
VARALAGILRRGAAEGVRTEVVVFNGQPGLFGRDREDRVVFAMTLQIADGRVLDVASVVNPDKLGHLGPVSDLARRDRP